MEFVVLPDHPAGTDALALAPASGLPGPKVIEHHSGRPWLVGDWPDDEIVSVSAARGAWSCSAVRRCDRSPWPPG